MKGSPIRKRYILFHTGTAADLQVVLRRVLEKYGCKKKFVSGAYGIVLTDQFQKAAVCDFLNSSFPGSRIVTVSGTIRKCKESMKEDSIQ